MKAETLMDALSGLDDTTLAEADRLRNRKRVSAPVWSRVLLAAAGFAVVIAGAGIFALGRMSFGGSGAPKANDMVAYTTENAGSYAENSDEPCAAPGEHEHFDAIPEGLTAYEAEAVEWTADGALLVRLLSPSEGTDGTAVLRIPETVYEPYRDGMAETGYRETAVSESDLPAGTVFVFWAEDTNGDADAIAFVPVVIEIKEP